VSPAHRLFADVELASLLIRQAPLLRDNGGVTFSGGEPLMQSAFLADTIDRLQGLHVTLDSSGYAPPEEFRLVAGQCDLVLFDLKLMNAEAHRRWTGVENDPILHNLALLAELGTPFVIRVPLVPGVTDTDENLCAIARRVSAPPGRPRVEFLDCAIETIDAVLALALRYAETARQMGRYDIAAILDRVPAHPAATFHEALQTVRLCHAVLWLSGHYHCGLGRFDHAAAEELLGEFFISLNKDSDLYPGIQQGDNGQSLMLGGVRRDGSEGVNPLTGMALRVACAVALIDPKINLRVTRHTDLELLALAAELTRIGLGFPQYANDEVVIPGLVAAGYELEDARDYTVAACWEFIIPGQGMEVVNIGAASLPAAADKAICEGCARTASLALLLAEMLQRFPHRGAGNLDGSSHGAAHLHDQEHGGRQRQCAKEHHGDDGRIARCDQPEAHVEQRQPKEQDDQERRRQRNLGRLDLQPAAEQEFVAEVLYLRLQGVLSLGLRLQPPDLL
jgi:pyruvate-formate lyase-activating enzyme